MNNTDSPNPIDDILDSRGLSIFMLILTLVILGFLITNVVYFKRIANDPSTSASNAKAAKNLGWINIVLAVALGIVVIYYLFKSFTNKQTRNILYAEAGQQVASVQNAIPTLSGPAIAVVNYNGKNISIYRNSDGTYTNSSYPGAVFTCDYNNCDMNREFNTGKTVNGNPVYAQPTAAFPTSATVKIVAGPPQQSIGQVVPVVKNPTNIPTSNIPIPSGLRNSDVYTLVTK